MSLPHAVSIQGVSHFYGKRQAINQLCLDVAPGQIFAVLGPNGGGKSTLFRLLSTLMPVQSGTIEVCGANVMQQRHRVREHIGVVFQMPSLDKKLTVWENIQQQAALYGLTSPAGKQHAEQLMQQLEIADRRNDFAEDLSGGLRRRVELAKGMLHQPQVLLLDEPSTGLDPAARRTLWQTLVRLREEQGTTILLTSHILEEAEKADQIAILDEGKLIAVDNPSALKDQIGGETITIRSRSPQRLADLLRQQLTTNVQVVADQVRLESDDGPTLIKQIMAIGADEVEAITLSKPSLEDVFITMTGHAFSEDRPND